MIKNILSLPLTIVGLIFFYFFRKTPNLFYKSYVKSYCFTRGLSQQLIFNLLKTFSLDKRINENDFTTILSEQFNFNKINEKISNEGYYIFEDKLKNEYIDLLTQFSLNTKCFFYDQNKVIKTQYYEKNSDNYISNKYDYEENDLYNNQIIRALIFDKNFLKIANNFFGTKPLYSSVNMWWSPVIKKEVDIKLELATQSAQLFHFDLDRIKWLKFFIYLTDTSEYDGPHEYVQGTHKVFGKSSEIAKLEYQRIPAELIDKYYPNKLKKIIGKKGTIFVGDTSAIHRGSPPLINSRLVLVIEYANSLFGSEYKKIRSNITGKINSKYSFLIKEKILKN